MQSKQENSQSFKDSIKQINQIFQGETGIYRIFEVYGGVLKYENYGFPDGIIVSVKPHFLRLAKGLNGSTFL